MKFNLNQTEIGEIINMKQCSVSVKIKKCNWKLTEIAQLVQSGALNETEVIDFIRTYRKG